MCVPQCANRAVRNLQVTLIALDTVLSTTNVQSSCFPVYLSFYDGYMHFIKLFEHIVAIHKVQQVRFYTYQQT